VTERAERVAPLVTSDVALGNVREEDLVEVRVRMRPDQPMHVSMAEAQDLFAQGLLVKKEEVKGDAGKRQ
jgi:hypothetical protein